MSEPSMRERIARVITNGVHYDVPPDAIADGVLAETHTDELLTALEAITDHFAGVMDGPMIKGAGVVWPNGVEGIRTIKVAREAIRAARAGR